MELDIAKLLVGFGATGVLAVLVWMDARENRKQLTKIAGHLAAIYELLKVDRGGSSIPPPIAYGRRGRIRLKTPPPIPRDDEP